MLPGIFRWSDAKVLDEAGAMLARLALGAADGDPDAAAKNLASFDPESLWVKFAQSAYPDFPQTPGSAKWNEAEAAGNPHETVDNPFLR